VRGAQEGLDELVRFLTEGPLGLSQQQLDSALQSVAELLQSSGVQSGAISGATLVAEVITGILLGFVLLFFVLRDGDRIWAFIRQFLPERDDDRYELVAARSVDVLGGDVRGTAVIAFVDAVLIGIALAVLKVPLALPLAVIVFLTSFIPLVGATLAGTLAALVALVANGPIVALIVVAIVILVNQLEGDLLQPVVMAQSLKLHPLVILIALTAGTILGGIAGAVLAVPLTAVVWAIIKVWDAPDPSLDQRKTYHLRRRRHDEVGVPPASG